jgi:hypothetical protein
MRCAQAALARPAAPPGPGNREQATAAAPATACTADQAVHEETAAHAAGLAG